MLQDFKAFIAKGNVLDLAVAVIIGAAFGAIVTSLTGDIIMPVIGAIFGGADLSNQFILLSVPAGYEGSMTDYAALKEAGAAMIGWGAFVAGLRAGKYYPTFPRMGTSWIPPELLSLEPAARNFLENPIAVQWAHRVIGTLLLLSAALFAWRVLRAHAEPITRRLVLLLLALIGAQYVLGVLTLIHVVPVPLGVTHQAVASRDAVERHG